MKYFVTYILLGVGAWVLNAGMLFSAFQGEFPHDHKFNQRWRRQDAGMAIFLGGIDAVVWPVGTPVVFCMTGFAEYGIWRGY